jgi:L-amino acid N-acyltransferase
MLKISQQLGTCMATEIKDKQTVMLRDATSGDLETIRSIYNHYVLNSTATFDTAAQTAEQRREWFDHHRREGLPVFVAETQGQIVGWGSLSYYGTRCAYRTSVEPSVYVLEGITRQGVGRALMSQLISAARYKRYHCVIGLVCSENRACLNWIEMCGFERVGELKEVGRKFDRWLNVTIMQKVLNN